MPKNIKLALCICYLYDATIYILYFSKFISFINYIIILYIINQSNAAIESQINNIINASFKDLYLIIAVMALNSDIPT